MCYYGRKEIDSIDDIERDNQQKPEFDIETISFFSQ
jgi:hypothetical protein